ncbi:MAG: SRPBCC family protein [Actinomycetota bacterium]|nr:SRPBCC family protein [Actinomycetota bacterium]
MAFSLTERSVEWIDRAPVRVEGETVVNAAANTVFATLADHESWPAWFPGMRRARVDGRAAGVGATRTVWVGPIAVKEKFVTWEPATRFSFTLTESSAPGLASMVEDLQLEAVTAGQTRVRYVIGVAAAGLGGVLDPVLRLGAQRIVSQALKGLSDRHG